MGLKTISAGFRGPAFRAFVVVGVVGLLLVCLPPLSLLSFDLATLLRPRSQPPEVIMVHATEATLEKLGSAHGLLNRTNHARLLDHLARDGAKLVFYDFAFTEPSPNPADDVVFEAALRRHGRVVLIATAQEEQQAQFQKQQFRLLPAFRKAATNWGPAEFRGNVVRELTGSYDDTPSAVWQAVRLTAPEALNGQSPESERWLNYYGPVGRQVFSNELFHTVLEAEFPAGVFKDKVVFVGQNFAVDALGARRDTFLTPYSRFGLKPMSGAAIHATAYLNLVRGEWQRLAPLSAHGLGALVWAGLITATLFRLSRRPLLVSLVIALVGGGLLLAVSLWIQWRFHVWWNWIAPVVGQTTLALIWVRLHPKAEKYLAFISYRNEDDGAAALLIQRSLADRGLRVFLDVRSLEAGHFDEQLLREIESTGFFVLILSPKSLARCVNPDDWVLRELTHALAKGKPVVPVFRGGFTFDAKEHIPDLPQIAELRRFQGVLYSNADFDGFMEKLVKLLKT